MKNKNLTKAIPNNYKKLIKENNRKKNTILKKFVNWIDMDEKKLLFDFFMWFRENGEKYIGKLAVVR